MCPKTRIEINQFVFVRCNKNTLFKPLTLHTFRVIVCFMKELDKRKEEFQQELPGEIVKFLELFGSGELGLKHFDFTYFINNYGLSINQGISLLNKALSIFARHRDTAFANAIKDFTLELFDYIKEDKKALEKLESIIKNNDELFRAIFGFEQGSDLLTELYYTYDRWKTTEQTLR